MRQKELAERFFYKCTHFAFINFTSFRKIVSSIVQKDVDSTMGSTALVVHDYVCKIRSGVFVLIIELVKAVRRMQLV